MIARFNGKRLKQARIYRGMTVAELSELLGCQRQTLSMYEIGKSQPVNKSYVEQLAQILDFPVSFFYENSPTYELGTVYFRSLLTTNKKYRSEQIVKMDFLSQVYSLLQDYIEFPKFEQPYILNSCPPETAASILRDTWGLGQAPLDNLISIAEQHGVLVTSFRTSTDDVDAFSQLVATSGAPTYLIAYSNNKTSAARIHFDIAHELGHICLHEWSEDIEELSKEDFRNREREANEFAAAFLMPEQTFRQDAESGPQTIPHYKQLKKKWKVSIAAMIRRAEGLHIMSKETYQSLIRTMQRRGQRKEEPLDDVLMTSSPALLKTSVMMLLQEDVFTPNEFMTELSRNYGLTINAKEVEYLLDLPDGVLAQSNVIDFTALQIKRKGAKGLGR